MVTRGSNPTSKPDPDGQVETLQAKNEVLDHEIFALKRQLNAKTDEEPTGRKSLTLTLILTLTRIGGESRIEIRERETRAGRKTSSSPGGD